MNLATRKNNFIQELTTIDEKLFEKLEIVLKINKKDWFLDLTLKENKEIEIGLQQADKDEFVSQEIVMNKFAKQH
jgi:hypothetical protein